MQMKRAVVEFQIEGSIEIEIPEGSSESSIDKIARAEVRKLAGPLSVDITEVRVTEIDDNGGF